MNKKLEHDLYRVLKLTLKKKWFDMILSGEKTEEYRDIKDYWIKRLLTDVFNSDYSSIINNPEFYLNGRKSLKVKSYDYVEFSNGYGKNVPKIIIEYKHLSINYGEKQWGANTNEIYFVIGLGKIAETHNLK